MVLFFLLLLYFNSHAHVERDRVSAIRNYGIMNFNSHAHVERDQLSQPILLNIQISTHTLTWSVTGKDFLKGKINKISTHTLTWSVTEKTMQDLVIPIISTHTLTWSVTS